MITIDDYESYALIIDAVEFQEQALEKASQRTGTYDELIGKANYPEVHAFANKLRNEYQYREWYFKYCNGDQQ